MLNSLTSWRPRLRLIRRLAWPDRLLLIEACLAVGVARALVLTVPFRWLAHRLDRMNEATPHTEHADVTRTRVTLALRAVSRHTPWESNCLARALAGKVLLARRGLGSTLYLGVAKTGPRLAAHAWLRCGSVIVTGGPEHERFTVIATFGSRR